jgi:hypothetical protein
MEKSIDIGLTSVMALISAVFAFLGLSSIQFIILIILMSLDMVTGIAKVYRVNRTSVKSSVLKIGLFSKMFYLFVPIVLALAAKGINIDNIGMWFASFCITILISSETYSILGIIYSFKTGKETHKIEGASYILIFIRKLIKKMVEKEIQ